MPDWVEIGNVGNVTAYTITGLLEVTEYDIQVRWYDGITYGDWTEIQATTLLHEQLISLSSNNVEPFDYYSTDGTGTIITREVSLDGSGGTVESDVLTAYLICKSATQGAKVSIANEDAGVSWLFSDDNVTFTTELIFGYLSTGSATTVYIKVEVDNDGTVSGNQQSAKIQIYRKI